MASSKNLGALTTTYKPKGPNCNSVFQASESDFGYWLQYGTVSTATTDCLPSHFDALPQYYYSPGLCPSGYDYACEAGIGTGTASSTIATCCPESYLCRGDRLSTESHACYSQLVTNSFFEVSVYTIANDGTAVVDSSTTTAYYTASDVIFAKGIIVHRGSGDASWSSPTPTKTTPPGSTTKSPSSSQQQEETYLRTTTTSGSTSSPEAESDGISQGARIGIGVGVAAGVLLIAAALTAFIIIRRRRAAAPRGPIELEDDKTALASPVEIYTMTKVHELPEHPPAELEG